MALKDPKSGNLDRIQIVKGWIDAAGKQHEKIYDVIWSGDRKIGADGKLPPVGNTVDVKTATYTNDIGAGQLADRLDRSRLQAGRARLLLCPRARDPDAALEHLRRGPAEDGTADQGAGHHPGTRLEFADLVYAGEVKKPIFQIQLTGGNGDNGEPILCSLCCLLFKYFHEESLDNMKQPHCTLGALVIASLTLATLASAQTTGGQTDVGQADQATLEKVHPAKPPYSPYAGRNFPTRPFFGDTHLHTSFSMDAGAFGARLGPRDAYRFARGEEVTASSGQPAKLSRPLDFLVVADHSDGIGFFPQLMSGDPELLADAARPQVVRPD